MDIIKIMPWGQGQQGIYEKYGFNVKAKTKSKVLEILVEKLQEQGE